jgi:hypothetical protein
MIDPSGRIDNELSNIIGTVARANPKLKLEVASIALILFPGGCWYFRPAIIYKSICAARVSELTKKLKKTG